jgi:hypothetical protein
MDEANDPGQTGPPAPPPSLPPAAPVGGPPPPPSLPPPTPAGLQPSPGWTPTPSTGGSPPRGAGTKLWWGIGAAVLILVAAGVVVFALTRGSKPTVASKGIGASTPTATTTPSAAPTSTATAATLTGATGGFGDTATNPDSTFICAASASSSGAVIAYTTVAGSDSSTGNTMCSNLEQGGAWTAITSISAQSYKAPSDCWLSTASGGATARIYTAIPGGNDAGTQSLCTTLFGSAGVTPSPAASPSPT